MTHENKSRGVECEYCSNRLYHGHVSSTQYCCVSELHPSSHFSWFHGSFSAWFVCDFSSRFLWLPVAMVMCTPVVTIKIGLASVVTVLRWSKCCMVGRRVTYGKRLAGIVILKT